VAKPWKGKKVLEAWEPQIEESKKILFIRGRQSSPVLEQLFILLSRLPVPKVIKKRSKHNLVPFNETFKMERFCERAGCSLCLIATRSAPTI
jgi:hypothetical protein